MYVFIYTSNTVDIAGMSYSLDIIAPEHWLSSNTTLCNYIYTVWPY